MKILKADLHNHFSTRSKLLEVNRVVDKVYETLGEGGVCALVNYNDRRFEAFAERAESKSERLGNAVYFSDRDILILKGEEIPTLEGDLLILGLREGEYLQQRNSLDYSLKEALDLDGIVIATSPFFRSKVGETLMKDKSLLAHIDAIEIHNGECTKRANRRALNFYNNMHNYTIVGRTVGALASSDGHSLKEVGSSYTEFTIPEKLNFKNIKKTNDEIRKIIRYTHRTFKKTYSVRGALEHAAILSGIILVSKAGINISKGDKEARR